ncbi:MAG: hypothetical protein J4415_03305 [Candidatus Diapherotrites archaeon]|uniref:Uncharacterized protein n=1 Tax=Candidatus Iainarchaeum sp. TaxID=3101447 RepID=A0A8T4KTD5_9ARCH|nr:hypothetical protein [Candidatus Diapherotrites archaeon]
MLKRYKFYGGKKIHTEAIEETGQDLGGRMSGTSRRILVKFKRKKPLPFAEKILKIESNATLMQTVFILNQLKKIGLSTIPTARIAIGKDPKTPEKRVRQIMTDLTCGGKLKVIDYAVDGHIMGKTKELKNFEEIKKQITKENEIASEHGFKFDGNEWLIAVDPNTNMGKPYIVDTKGTQLNNRNLVKQYMEWQAQLLQS